MSWSSSNCDFNPASASIFSSTNSLNVASAPVARVSVACCRVRVKYKSYAAFAVTAMRTPGRSTSAIDFSGEPGGTR